MSYQRLPIKSNGHVDISSLDIKNISTMKVVDAVIIQPEFHLNEIVILNGQRITFWQNHSIDDIISTIRSEQSNMNAVKVENNRISIFVAGSLEFESKGKISELLGFTGKHYSGDKEYVTAEARLDLCVNYYNIEHNRCHVGVISENKVIESEIFDVISKCVMRVRSNDNSKLICSGGHLLLRVQEKSKD